METLVAKEGDFVIIGTRYYCGAQRVESRGGVLGITLTDPNDGDEDFQSVYIDDMASEGVNYFEIPKHSKRFGLMTPEQLMQYINTQKSKKQLIFNDWEVTKVGEWYIFGCGSIYLHQSQILILKGAIETISKLPADYRDILDYIREYYDILNKDPKSVLKEIKKLL